MMKMPKEGLIHIYCGDGKGKTTAAIGLSIRALGRLSSHISTISEMAGNRRNFCFQSIQQPDGYSGRKSRSQIYMEYDRDGKKRADPNA